MINLGSCSSVVNHLKLGHLFSTSTFANQFWSTFCKPICTSFFHLTYFILLISQFWSISGKDIVFAFFSTTAPDNHKRLYHIKKLASSSILSKTVIYKLREFVLAGVRELSSQPQLLSQLRTQDTKNTSYV